MCKFLCLILDVCPNHCIHIWYMCVNVHICVRSVKICSSYMCMSFYFLNLVLEIIWQYRIWSTRKCLFQIMTRSSMNIKGHLVILNEMQMWGRVSAVFLLFSPTLGSSVWEDEESTGFLWVNTMISFLHWVSMTWLMLKCHSIWRSCFFHSSGKWGSEQHCKI